MVSPKLLVLSPSLSTTLASLVTSIEETGAASINTTVGSLSGSPSPSSSVGVPLSETSSIPLKFPGILPTALAVLVIKPESAASWLMTYKAVNITDSPTSTVCGCQ